MSKQPSLGHWTTTNAAGMERQGTASMSAAPSLQAWCDDWLPSWADNQADLLSQQLNLQSRT